MASFRVVADSALTSEPVERSAQTALEAQEQYLALRRQYGLSSKISVYGERGREITLDRLRGFITAEIAEASSRGPHSGDGRP